MHVLSQAEVVDSWERGRDVEVQICAMGGEGVGGFHTHPIQGNNVVTNLSISTS